ncbi:lyase [Longispora fulva]|uniref:Poly(Beta-D-mannuronate) lyase n=1 Tax=Longispora fulva TaxID=619741 RepID=A0A8J7GGQ4_9ACTN|nr:polysaccharide lyase 6 family protein [Longispora fulva]MBG6137636.1 poly(beta-D-mannuronate) lyase [Longispora fulva]GIG62205.1 lyase [Longispora fulva]
MNPISRRVALGAALVLALPLGSWRPADATVADPRRSPADPTIPADQTEATRTDRVAQAARIVPVASVAALRTALGRAQPGDRIELADGVHTTTSPILVPRSGTAAAPVTVAAAHLGRAEITGTAGFAFGSGVSHVVVEGFRFTHTAGIEVPAGSAFVRLTRNVVRLAGSTQYWVTVAGDDCELDHNLFQHKSTLGNFVEVVGPGSGMAQRVLVHHNHFLDHSYRGGNGGEAIRFGLSGRQHASARGRIENNLFERCDGDLEVVSVKSSDNVVRYNTLLNCQGTITLRHGNRTRVEGNLLLGGAGGIRVYGDDHVVVDNVVQNSGYPALSVGGGEIVDDTGSTTDHERADRLLAAFNTFVGAGPLVVFGGGKKYGPRTVTLANTILLGTGGGALVQVKQGSELTFAGNIAWSGTPGMPAGGYRQVDPRLVRDATGLYRPAAGSPAIDGAVGAYPQVGLDLDGQVRGGRKDVGADETGAPGATRGPLTPADVGPTGP